MTAAREKRRLVPLKAIATGRPTLLANVAIKTPPVITLDVIIGSPFWQAVQELQFHQANMPQFQIIFLNRYVCGSCGAVGFRSG